VSTGDLAANVRQRRLGDRRQGDGERKARQE